MTAKGRVKRSSLQHKRLPVVLVVSFLMLLSFSGAELFAEESAALAELKKLYEGFSGETAQRDKAGYDVSSVSISLLRAYRALGKADEVAVRYELAEVATKLQGLERRMPKGVKEFQPVLLSGVFKGLLKLFLTLFLLALLMARWPLLDEARTGDATWREEVPPVLAFSTAAFVGSQVIWEVPLSLQPYYVNLDVVLPLVAGLSAGEAVGIATGVIVALGRLAVFSLNPLALILPIGGGLIGAALVSVKRDFIENPLATFLAGSLLGSLQGSFVYLPHYPAIGFSKTVVSIGGMSLFAGVALSTFFLVFQVVLNLEKRQEAEASLLATKLKLLQSQIKPHFLFNTLNTIAGFYRREDSEQARTLVMKLAVFLRALFGTDHTMSSLKEELNFMQTYFDIEKARFPEKLYLEIRNKLTAPLEAVQCPILIIQPLVENAIKHGIRPKEGDGTVVVEMSEEPGGILIAIRDDGVGFDLEVWRKKRHSHVSHDHAGIALYNIDHRLRHFTGGRGLEVKTSPGGGTEIRFHLLGAAKTEQASIIDEGGAQETKRAV